MAWGRAAATTTYTKAMLAASQVRRWTFGDGRVESSYKGIADDALITRLNA